MPTKHKHPALSIEDKITIYECLDKGSSKREIACEYFLSISCISFDYPEGTLYPCTCGLIRDA